MKRPPIIHKRKHQNTSGDNGKCDTTRIYSPFNPDQLVNHFIDEESISSLRFDTFDPPCANTADTIEQPDNSLSESTCQSSGRLSHLQTQRDRKPQSQSATAQSVTPWTGVITQPVNPSKSASNYKRDVMQAPFVNIASHKDKRTPRKQPANNQRFSANRFVEDRPTIISSRKAEPREQSTTYQLPNRSRQVNFGHTLTRSFPRVVVLFLIGVALACAVGVAYPNAISWIAFISMVGQILSGLFVVVALSWAISFALESR